MQVAAWAEFHSLCTNKQAQGSFCLHRSPSCVSDSRPFYLHEVSGRTFSFCLLLTAVPDTTGPITSPSPQRHFVSGEFYYAGKVSFVLRLAH